MPTKDAGGRWPTIADGIARDHRCLLLFFHLLHAVYAVPWKSCCRLTPEQPGYDNEKKKIERRFTGHTRLGWEDITCYLDKLPEPTREHAATAAFCLFKRWCEGSRTGRTASAREEAHHALAAAEAATAGRQGPPVAWLLLTPGAGSSTPPIMMTPDVATDGPVGTSGPDSLSVAPLVPRADLEQVERELAVALERAREAGDRAQEAEDRLAAVTREQEEASRQLGPLRADVFELGARLIQARKDLAAERAVVARAADLDARAARVDDRERAVREFEARTVARLNQADERAQQAAQLAEQLREQAAHLAAHVAFLEEQINSVPTAADSTGSAQPAVGTGSWRRRRADRRQDEISRQQEDENRRAQIEGQASLTAELEATDRLRRDLVDTVVRELRGPLVEIRDALTAARDGQPADGPLTDRLTAAAHLTSQLERLLDSMVTATTVATTDVNASDLALALADVQRGLADTHAAGGALVIDTSAHLPVRMDWDPLRQLLVHLTDDALRAATPGAPVHVGAGRVGDRVLLRIRTPARPFSAEPDDAAATTSTAAGIRYVIEQILNAHGGQLRVDTHHGNGIFDILDVELPAADLMPRAEPVFQPPTQHTGEPTDAQADDHNRQAAVRSS